MKVLFYLNFCSKFGESIKLNLYHSNGSLIETIELTYLNPNTWHGHYDNDALVSTLSYQYALFENEKNVAIDRWGKRNLDLSHSLNKELEVFDDWIYDFIPNQLYRNKAFSILKVNIHQANDVQFDKEASHFFQIKTIGLSEEMSIVMLGSGEKLKNWNEESPVFLNFNEGTWNVEIDLKNESLPLEYKFGLYDLKEQKFITYEPGPNRKIIASNNRIQIRHHYASFNDFGWKGVGLNIPLTALKTEKSWGVGDFTDLQILIQWVKVTGMKMIQLLPINDTTANFTTTDSYPYASISAFALHPIYLDVSSLGKNYGIEFTAEITSYASQLNELSLLDYNESLLLKLKAIDIIFQKQKDHFVNEKAFHQFFDNNKTWLVPYAFFCCLRDEFKTANFNQWGQYATYDASNLDELLKENTSLSYRTSFYFFIQYHLHLQLSSAVSFAHANGIIIKGDLPIGVGRFSVETWMNPQLFHMDLQAGAPPDAFSSKGQNWGFPTYNWNEMKKDRYQWWRNRLNQLSKYFDAVRIDHVLGFFRIWSIPMHAVEGIFGVFDPAIPLTTEDFKNIGIEFDEQKFCEPFFTDEQLKSIFKSDFNWVNGHFFANGRFKDEYNTQIKIQDYFNQNTDHIRVKEKLFELLSDVLLFRDNHIKGAYHFRINFQQTYHYKTLTSFEKTMIEKLYWHYFFEKQNNDWQSGAIDKLDMIQSATDMLICAEDLGMVPEMVEEVLLNKEILTLQVQRMPKRSYEKFSHPEHAPYLSVVTPSTHDMSTIRQWWHEDEQTTNTYYREVLHQKNITPQSADTELCKLIIKQHMNATSMWAVFLLQDLLSIDEGCRRENLDEERINNPTNPYHYWNYRMHITLELLLNQRNLNETIKQLIIISKR